MGMHIVSMFSETKLVNPLPPHNEIISFCEKSSIFMDDPLRDAQICFTFTVVRVPVLWPSGGCRLACESQGPEFETGAGSRERVLC